MCPYPVMALGGECGGLGLLLGLVSELGVASDSSWGVVQ